MTQCLLKSLVWSAINLASMVIGKAKQPPMGYVFAFVCLFVSKKRITRKVLDEFLGEILYNGGMYD